ncbi:MAG TPA: uroporphyrinogen decarboxylase family protein [bacterium]|nr:uroporphyrinogen decarboxylase family protein [bacterium]HOL49406.1 uroporphyrinogen decarboxylase family protein [bacterium]HPO52744.1 uroporphyrinogen decarboxylase family protein [bacterium]HXK45030.1 uroporphyrinogen decarboxylase family protein [bacterium]
MTTSARKLRDIYGRKPYAPFFQKEFGFFTLERWKKEGKIDDNTNLDELFGFDPPGNYNLAQLGWTIAPFEPAFETKIIEDKIDYELVQDESGRHVLFFKGRRNGFMPEYVAHPVKDWKTWIENVKWRLDLRTETRRKHFLKVIPELIDAQNKGLMITERVIGGYMYLRCLIGPSELPLFFYDHPDVIHDCMKTWFELANAIIEMHQQYTVIDELFFGEDICYNHGPLISPQMIKEFLFPYYQQLITNIKSRQAKSGRHLYFHLDTDGYAVSVIPLYKELGMDVMSPFEVASGCDVVRDGQTFPDIAMFGGIDKRVLAKTKDEIDRHLDRILPAMYKRGGYIPTCDHGVPEEVSFENYMHYRKRILEYN